MASERAQWSSRWGFILAATGSAVGLGNIWRFPYMTGENGGGWFVLIYLLCVALIGLPIMTAEIMSRSGYSASAKLKIRNSGTMDRSTTTKT